MFPTFALVSILSVSSASPAKPGHTVTVRSLVQGSGSVVVFDSAADMPREVVSFVRGGGK